MAVCSLIGSWIVSARSRRHPSPISVHNIISHARTRARSGISRLLCAFTTPTPLSLRHYTYPPSLSDICPPQFPTGVFRPRAAGFEHLCPWPTCPVPWSCCLDPPAVCVCVCVCVSVCVCVCECVYIIHDTYIYTYIHMNRERNLEVMPRAGTCVSI